VIPSGRSPPPGRGKELLRAVYAADDLASARVALDRFYRWCDGVQIFELSRLAPTVRAWQTEILAWHLIAGCSNGPTEAINLLIKKVKRSGTASLTSRTIGSGCCCTAASGGRLTAPQDCEAAHERFMA
jgi:Transposase